ncbi:hypothetical protein SDD30_14215 [Moorella naiadis]|uniref:hypothetical protein n=1 Tax=Moorella naiadis (nom. illeg.) TaxID=3093670 RepID=UPI003D9C9BF9
MFSGLIYLLLAAGSFFMLLAGFDPYNCASSSCGAVSYIFGRPLLQWGAAYYFLVSSFCLAGVARKKFFLAVIYCGVGIHAFLLMRAWKATGELCFACLEFLLLEILLAVYITARPPARASIAPVFIALVGLLSVGVLLYPVPGYFRPAGINLASAGAAGVKTEAIGQAVLPVQEKVPTNETGEENVYRKRLFATSTSGGVINKGEGKTGQASNTETASNKMALEVKDTDGRRVTLDLNKRPALFFAWWCSHCTDVLRELVGLPEEKRPYLVGAFLQGNDISRFQKKLAEAGLAGGKFYLADNPPDGVKGVPALEVCDAGTIKFVQGNVAIAKVLKGGGSF